MTPRDCRPVSTPIILNPVPRPFRSASTPMPLWLLKCSVNLIFYPHPCTLTPLLLAPCPLTSLPHSILPLLPSHLLLSFFHPCSRHLTSTLLSRGLGRLGGEGRNTWLQVLHQHGVVSSWDDSPCTASRVGRIDQHRRRRRHCTYVHSETPLEAR